MRVWEATITRNHTPTTQSTVLIYMYLGTYTCTAIIIIMIVCLTYHCVMPANAVLAHQTWLATRMDHDLCVI